MPRRKLAAAKPAVSPMTPPPTAMSGAAAVGAALDERVVDARHRGQRLVALAVGDEDRLAGDGRLDACALMAPDDRARHDEALAPDAVLIEQRGEPVAEAFTDQDGGVLVRGGDLDLRGGEDWVCHLFDRGPVTPTLTPTAMRFIVCRFELRRIAVPAREARQRDGYQSGQRACLPLPD